MPKYILDHKAKNRILDLSAKGYSNRSIAQKMNIGKSTIGDFLSKNSHKEWWMNEAALNKNPETSEPPFKMLFHDIETAPTEAYVWGRFKQNIGHNQVIQEGYALTWSAQWFGQDDIMWDSIHTQEDWEESIPTEDDFEICKTLWSLYDEADIIVAHNANFDIKTMNSRFVYWGLKPPSPYKVIDTLKIARQKFRFPSNRLDALADFLSVGRKQDTGGFDLWRGCKNGDKASFEKMLKYNINDVDLLRKVYMKLRAWDDKHPNLSNYYEDSDKRCVVCGGNSLIPTKQKVHTGVSSFPALLCVDCGHWSRGRENVKSKEKMKNTLINT